MNDKQEVVYKILLTPIDCSKKYKHIELKDNYILTPQTYYCKADEDMSDFAVGFYEIVYSSILKGNHILDGRYFKDKEFAGDTMNSYNTIAKLIESDPDANLEELSLFKMQYHCLANFWLIPMKHGRRGKKKNKYDSYISYVIQITDDYDDFVKEHEYFKSFNGPDDFKEKHYIANIELDPDWQQDYKDIQRYSHYIEQANNMMKQRAKNMVEDEELCNKLYCYFNSLGLI